MKETELPLVGKSAKLNIAHFLFLGSKTKCYRNDTSQMIFHI